MFDDILLASFENMPFLNNGAFFPKTSVRGCKLSCGGSFSDFCKLTLTFAFS